MKLFFKNTMFTLLMTLFLSHLISCQKTSSIAEIQISYQQLVDKTWYLDFSIIGNSKMVYVGDNTYYINFLQNKTTIDSDGINGTYSIEKKENHLQILVHAITTNSNHIDYIYSIESLDASKLVLSYTKKGETLATKLYFRTNK